jgi:hypothetical protein
MCISADVCGDLCKSFKSNIRFSYFGMSMENRSNVQEEIRTLCVNFLV